ncbi:hypothetical protein GOQ29_03405 [Clostridium sp. D2Q-14]|uniref:hypothetical protein n=1 Tax=Anaeromonas gelatinilytica TaxID=2683194 RepID=UPI00193B8196|nr:hypothetical protein [Anaeromonas gelatinilytica]MBS4534657.1 hypothetical protein [Anaeromonas gelatinilytica]
MNKYRVEIDWLNKLYDDIYYNELKNSEHALDIISSLIADKESKSVINEDKNISSIVIEVSEELADILEIENLTECYNFIIDKIEQIQNGELDEILKEEYFPDLYDLEEDTEFSDNDLNGIYEDIDSIDEEDLYMNEFLEENLDSDNLKRKF